MLIDAHAHIYEELRGYGPRGEFRALGGGKGIWATGEVAPFFPAEYGDKGFLAEALLQIMDENGVDHAVLLQGGNYGFHNEYTAEAARNYPARFTPVGTVDPYARYAEQIMDHLVNDLRVHALKFEISQSWGMSGYHPGLRLDNEQFAPLLKKADDLGMTVTLDIGGLGDSSYNLDAVRNIVKRYPNITFVMTHCFFPCPDGHNDERLGYMQELVSDRFYFDFANLPPCVSPEKYPFVTQQDFLREAKKRVGADHLIWGTDLPGILMNYTYRELTDYVTESDVFTPEELKLVMAENAVRVYHIDL